MNFSCDSLTQTNTALSTTRTSYTHVNSNDLSAKQDLLLIIRCKYKFSRNWDKCKHTKL